MIAALLLILLMAALIVASVLARRYQDAERPPENAKADERFTDDDRIAGSFPR
jgi:hypothetical protein